ncbi:hypothetical protein [Hafnia paralvei]|uniref:hypothetical protein n=1 Tax=Hafnia paralvei TaxID=546367 RepID=UPI00266CBEFF|nr:hypothetical protein [Hafnia paralvei]
MSNKNRQLYDLSDWPLVKVSAEFMCFLGNDWVAQTERLLAQNRPFVLIYPEVNVAAQPDESSAGGESARDARTIIAKWLKIHRNDFSQWCRGIVLNASGETASHLVSGLERMYGVPVKAAKAEQTMDLAKEIMGIS